MNHVCTSTVVCGLIASAAWLGSMLFVDAWWRRPVPVHNGGLRVLMGIIGVLSACLGELAMRWEMVVPTLWALAVYVWAGIVMSAVRCEGYERVCHVEWFAEDGRCLHFQRRVSRYYVCTARAVKRWLSAKRWWFTKNERVPASWFVGGHDGATDVRITVFEPTPIGMGWSRWGRWWPLWTWTARVVDDMLAEGVLADAGLPVILVFMMPVPADALRRLLEQLLEGQEVHVHADQEPCIMPPGVVYADGDGYRVEETFVLK